uniref:EB domain-containing protein n=1 Tax=Trichuris muris TaxID=70415 RepID=A0A5S6QTQ0_TRIMR
MACTTIRLSLFLLVAKVLISECCVLHENCIVPTALCINRQCVAATNMGIFCNNHVNCRTTGDPLEHITQFCRQGMCLQINRAFGTGRCLSHNDCPGETMCVHQVCVAARAMNYHCPNQGFCKVGERCIAGTCYQPVDIIY